MIMKKMKANKVQALYSYVVFRLQFRLHSITAVLPIFCGASHPKVQFEIAFFNCFCHEISCR